MSQSPKPPLFLCFAFFAVVLALSACRVDPSDLCEEEGKRECVLEQGNRTFRQCKDGRWQHGSCAKGFLCQNAQCLELNPCAQDEVYCQDDWTLLSCQSGQLPELRSCPKGQRCHQKACVEEGLLNSTKACAALEHLTEAELNQEYLRNDAHCGGCDKVCDKAKGQHCVLGQCVKTRCDAGECHVLYEQRYLCESCTSQCPASMIQSEQILPQGSHSLDPSNTSAEAYSIDGRWQYRLQALCACPSPNQQPAQPCHKGADGCLAGLCVCGALGKSCPEGIACVGGRCLCADGSTLCDGKLGDRCVQNRCVCGANEAPCGTLSDRCLNGLCVCGSQNASCGANADRCENGQCRCGNLQTACGEGMLCQNGQCICPSNGKRCLPGEICDAQGNCHCGNGPACDPLSATTCWNGQCHCNGYRCGLPFGNSCSKDGCLCGQFQGCKHHCDLVQGRCTCSSNDQCNRNEICQNGLCVCRYTNAPCVPPLRCNSAEKRCSAGGDFGP